MNIRDVPLEKGPIRGRHAELTPQVKSLEIEKLVQRVLCTSFQVVQ